VGDGTFPTLLLLLADTLQPCGHAIIASAASAGFTDVRACNMQDRADSDPLYVDAVHISSAASQELAAAWQQLPTKYRSLVGTLADLQRLLMEALSLDFRSLHQRKQAVSDGAAAERKHAVQYHLLLVGLDVQYTVDSACVQVSAVRVATSTQPSEIQSN
jgi:hypothetical protein